MKNKEILERAISRAVENGWDIDNWDGFEKLTKEERIQMVSTLNYLKYRESGNYYNIIFSHDFAKAFWGEKMQRVYGGVWFEYNDKPTTIEYHEVPIWQHHLQQMVLEEQPLKYLERFLDA